MELNDVMQKAVSAFAPTAENQEYAVDAALAAAERFIAGIGLRRKDVNWSELRNAALGIWNLYCEAALEAEFVVTSLCRNDLVQMGISEQQARLLSDEDLRVIAKKMEDSYTGVGSFWTDLATVASEQFEAKGLPPMQFTVKE